MPLAVVCLFDARDEKTETLNILGTHVPVIALSPIDVTGPTTTDVENINPITRELEPSPATKSELRLKEEDLKNLITERRALHFSHIGRPIGRHFTFYLDAARLLGETTIHAAFNREIDDWKTVPGSEVVKFDVWYPEPEPKPSAPAMQIAQRLLERPDVTLARGVRREAACGHWAFPTEHRLHLQSDNLVIVDWGAITGHSVTQMIRLAGQAGAKRVLVCIFLSQLPYEEELFLTSLQQLRLPQPAATPLERDFLPGIVPKEVRSVNVRVRFLGRFPVIAYDPNECPVCQTLARLSEDGSPTRLLEEFVNVEIHEKLNLRTREEVPKTPVDRYGRELLSTKVVWMARMREELAAALTSTYWRNAIADKLKAWADSQAGCTEPNLDALLHLLAVESHWIARPPLSFPRVRDYLGKIALARAMDEQEKTEDRQNALITLRVASKDLFAQNFSRLFISCQRSRELVARLCYSAFTYTSRRSRESSDRYRILQGQLALLSKTIADGGLRCSEDVVETLDRLQIWANAAIAIAGFGSMTPAQAWSRLRRELHDNYLEHQPVPSAIIMLQPGRDARTIERALLVSGPTAERMRMLDAGALVWLRSLNEEWTKCREFLDYTVLPLIYRIRTVLRGEDCTRPLGPETTDRLLAWAEQCVEERKTLADSEYSALIRDISQNPGRVLDRRSWDFFRNETAWHAECILNPSGANRRPSRIAQLLSKAPVDIAPVLNRVLGQLKDTGVLTRIQVHGAESLDALPKVFCVEELVADCVHQIIANVAKHRVSESPEVWVSAESCNELVRVVWCNNGTRPNQFTPGDGLHLLRKRLEAFNATLTSDSRPPEEGVTFSVEVMFQEA